VFYSLINNNQFFISYSDGDYFCSHTECGMSAQHKEIMQTRGNELHKNNQTVEA